MHQLRHQPINTLTNREPIDSSVIADPLWNLGVTYKKRQNHVGPKTEHWLDAIATNLTADTTTLHQIDV